MKLLVVTNRNVENKSAGDETLFGEGVNCKGPCELRLAWAKRKKKKWSLQLIKEPHNFKHKCAPSKAALSEYFKYVRKQRKACVFYIHGFDKRFVNSISQANEIAERYGVGVILFSWPSRPGGNIGERYMRARAIARNSIVALDRSFEMLFSNVSEWSDKKREISLNLLIHSLGNYIFKGFVSDPMFSCETRVFDNIVMNAPDVDLKGHEKWTDSLVYSRHVYVTINDKDGVLGASDFLINPSRLGNTARNLASNRLTYFDLSNGESVRKGHQHFGTTAQHNSVVNKFFSRVLQGKEGFSLLGTRFDHKKNAYVLRGKDWGRR